jgi:WD40 repeat protein
MQLRVNSGDDQLLKILEIVSGKVMSLGQGHSLTINDLVWTFDERQIVSAGEDGCLCVWNFYLGGAR